MAREQSPDARPDPGSAVGSAAGTVARADVAVVRGERRHGAQLRGTTGHGLPAARWSRRGGARGRAAAAPPGAGPHLSERARASAPAAGRIFGQGSGQLVESRSRLCARRANRRGARRDRATGGTRRAGLRGQV